MKIETTNGPNLDCTIFRVTVGRDEMDDLTPFVRSSVIALVAEKIAEDIITNDYGEIASKISPEAIANLALAQAAAKLNETIAKQAVTLYRPPLTIDPPETGRRGFFGGITRIR